VLFASPLAAVSSVKETGSRCLATSTSSCAARSTAWVPVGLVTPNLSESYGFGEFHNADHLFYDVILGSLIMLVNPALTRHC
jgi:hypothetical protein